MILSDGTIHKLIKSGDLVIDPLEPDAIQPASVDCRLGDHFLLLDDHNGVLTFNDEIQYREKVSNEMIIAPHTFLLATTIEYIKLPEGYSAFVEGRSSIGRMGLFIQNAGWVDAGFEGRITLELYNANSLPIRLETGRRICQLVFCRMDQPAKQPYQGKYQGQTVSVGSRIFQDQA
ncbi:MAG: dCTP deaminase [Actinobacteria bacterium]|nr:dCTP deaminase [Actinomycetota bacterium]|tara:strand:+ start:74 stop:601 length:528 start_codon:yes stop_codon:yes gene_type:complete